MCGGAIADNTNHCIDIEQFLDLVYSINTTFSIDYVFGLRCELNQDEKSLFNKNSNKSLIMFRNYLKIAIRNLLKNKAFSFINIFGLALGMTISMLIGLWIYDEYSYDHFHTNKDRIFRVMINGYDGNTGEKYSSIATVLPLVEEFKAIPEVQNVIETNWDGKWGLKVGDKKFNKTGCDVADGFFKTFQFKFLKGDVNTALADPSSILLTETTSRELFGTEDPMGKTVQWGGKELLKVSGIVQDMPRNSFFKEYQYFTPFSFNENRQEWVKAARTQWDNFSFQMYVELKPNTEYAQVEPKIKNIVKAHLQNSKHEVALHPMTKWRLYNQFKDWKAEGGRIDYVRIFGLVGFLVLLIACINFMNLSTARSEKRAKEVGIRKTIGSNRKDLILQFFGESLFISFLAFIMALLFIILSLPAFNRLLVSEISIPFSNPGFWTVALMVVFITGILAGSYPSLYLSSFDAVKVLKGTFSLSKSGTMPRKILVVTQFATSVALIICTILMYQQINYVQSLPIGYNPNGVMMVQMQGDIYKNYEVAKQDLLNTGIIESVTKASSPINAIWSNWNVTGFPGKQANEILSFANIAVSDDYFKTLQIKIKEGRNFYADASNSDSASVIINEAAVKRMRLSDPVGKIIQMNDTRLTIVGVVENTIMTNPYEPVGPTSFRSMPWANAIMFRIKENVAAKEVLAKVAPIFNKHNPDLPFEYEFADEGYAQKFELEVRVGKLAGIFSILTILISCLGLFGLSAYTAERRTKEIGIRKVLGASVPQVWKLISLEFVLLVLISCIIATPLALYYMKDWLSDYKNHINISWLVFVVATCIAVFISVVTVSFQAIKAAMANPIRSLRSE